MIRVERSVVLLACSLFLAFCARPGRSAPRPPSAPADPSGLAAQRPDEVLVQYKANARSSERAAIRSLARGRVRRDLAFIHAEHLQIQGVSVADAIERLRKNPKVEWAEPN